MSEDILAEDSEFANMMVAILKQDIWNGVKGVFTLYNAQEFITQLSPSLILKCRYLNNAETTISQVMTIA